MTAREVQSTGRRPGVLPGRRDPAALDAAVRRMKRVETFLKSEFDIDAYLTCGTLLGAMRHHDFIGIGADVDLAYLSREHTEAGIAEEHRRLVRALGREGMLIGMNSTGHMHVAVRRGEGEHGPEVCAVDLWTSWVRDGYFHHYPDVRGDLTAECLLPLQRRVLRGEDFWIPRRPELLLEALYGPSWRIPDSSLPWTGVHARAAQVLPGEPGPGTARLPECPRRADGVEVEPLANAFLVRQPGCEDVLRVNATAALILSLCDGETPVRELTDEVRRAYALASAPAVAVIDFLIRAVDDGLIC